MATELADGFPLDRKVRAVAAAASPNVRRIALHDLRAVLAEGWDDFSAHRTDVMFLCLLYPVLGLVLSRVTLGYGLLPVLFPLASGFALLGPLAGTGLYEISRQRQAGESPSWRSAFHVVRRPAFGAIVLLGLLLAMIFVLWIEAAGAIWQLCFGSFAEPTSVGDFLAKVFTTPQGWELIVLGNLAGVVLSVIVLAIGAFSFPMLIDEPQGRHTGAQLSRAVATSLRAVAANPVPMAGWGVTVAALLVLGSIPLFVGLVVVFPVLGHATWHLYRRVVAPPPSQHD
jgi:uncharacterized membrane protein